MVPPTSLNRRTHGQGLCLPGSIAPCFVAQLSLLNWNNPALLISPHQSQGPLEINGVDQAHHHRRLGP